MLLARMLVKKRIIYLVTEIIFPEMVGFFCFVLFLTSFLSYEHWYFIMVFRSPGTGVTYRQL